MTRWGVEREQRPARRASVVSPAGASALMPPPSQGAERQRRRSGRTGSPWGLRVLVVGGLAGTAWLLSGAAAQAADRDPATDLLGAVVHDITAAPHGGAADQRSAKEQGKHSEADRLHGVLPVVDRVLRTAVQPLEPGGRHDLGAVTTIPKRLVGTAGDVAGGTIDAAAPGTGRVIRDLTAPVRLPGEAVQPGQTTPVAAAPEEDRPEPGRGTTASGPEPTEPVTVPVGADRPQGEQPTAGQPRGERSTAGVPRDEQRHVTAEPAATRDTVGKTEVRHPDADSVATHGPVRETPDGDGPVRVHLGAANGAPASGSGTTTDSGPTAAVLPPAIADSTTACRLLPIATEVEVRRHDAEAPTASPD